MDLAAHLELRLRIARGFFLILGFWCNRRYYQFRNSSLKLHIVGSGHLCRPNHFDSPTVIAVMVNSGFRYNNYFIGHLKKYHL